LLSCPTLENFMVLEIGPNGGFTQGVKAEIEKNLFNLPQVTNKCSTLWPCIDPKTEKKKILWNLGSQFCHLGGGGPMFQHLIIF
jgi:hypothetical protein